MAVGGSTNAVIHLTAVAGRAGVTLPLERFDQLSRDTPLLASVRPSGQFHMEELYEAGGVPAVMKELEPLLNRDCLTVTGRTIGENLGAVQPAERFREVIASLEKPFKTEGGLAVVRGNLAPGGAVIKQAAASPPLLHHRGRAVVFTSLEDL